jgi:histidinol-phosphate aminotransferase
MTTPLADRLKATIRQDVQSMHAYAVQPSAGLIKLDAMENPFTLPAPLRAALGERLAAVEINRYPGARTADLMGSLAAYAELPSGCALMLGNGSDELIDLLSVACCKPGARILAPLPGFVMYQMSAQLRGLEFVGVPLTPTSSSTRRPCSRPSSTHAPALTYLAYPNNPTANLWDDAVIERIVEAVGAQDGWWSWTRPTSPSPRAPGCHAWPQPHVLVMRTLSKFGLAGVRLGYLCGAAALIAEIDKVRPPYNVSVLNAEAALFALEHADEYARQAACCARSATGCSRLAALPGVHGLPQRGQHDPGARARSPPRVRGHEGARRAGQAHRRPAPAAGQLPAPDGGHARRERRHDPRLEGAPVNRTTDLRRDTKETQIRVRVDLDGTGEAQLATGIGFFDHMLDQIARHGLIDLDVEAQGDLHIDGHHTVEDVGITLGQAVAQAVGDKKGITRYGHAYVPLDEALSRVVVDFSGRPGLHMRVPFKAGMIGGFDTQLAFEFFQGFATTRGSRCTSTT